MTTKGVCLGVVLPPPPAWVVNALNFTVVMAESILNIRKPMNYFFLRQERKYNAPKGKRNLSLLHSVLNLCSLLDDPLDYSS